MVRVRFHDPQTLSWWSDERDSIDMNPPYQRRGGLWSTRDKAYLIDSILNQFDIPKVYLADFTFGASPLNHDNRQYAVIDGKQRLEAIFDFFDGRITLDKSFVYLNDPTLGLAGLGYRDLKQRYPKIASRFENYNLSIMSVITDDEGSINELFVRLNRSKPLTGAEIRNAMEGLVPKLIRDLANQAFFKTRISFDTKRGEDLNSAAKLLLVEFRGRLVDTKKKSLDGLVEDGVKAEARLEDFHRAETRVQSVLKEMTEIFVERDPLLATQGPVTVYYWLVRSYGAMHGDVLREFLVRFEAARADNRQRARTDETKDLVDTELLRYDNLNRSTNDQGSLEGRLEILRERLGRFLEERGEQLADEG